MPAVVIPVLNEAGALRGLLAAMPEGYEPIVVDNGSSDGSGDLARSLGARVVYQPVKGFGSACWAGLEASDPDDDVVCFMDGDGSLDPRDLSLVAGPVLAGRADLVLGAREPSGRGVWPIHARLANRALAVQVRRRTGRRLADLGPMRAARRRRLMDLNLVDRGCGWPLEMVLKAAADNWRLQEVQVPYLPRTGRSKVTGTVAGTARAVRDMRRVFAATKATS